MHFKKEIEKFAKNCVRIVSYADGKTRTHEVWLYTAGIGGWVGGGVGGVPVSSPK